MEPQDFNPNKFISEVEKLYGNLEPNKLQSVENFARNIGDQIKLDRCIRNFRILASGLPQDEAWVIFILLLAVHYQFQAEKFTKPIQARIKRSHAKKKAQHLKKIKEAIELVKSLNPDHSKFNEEYLLNLAKEKVAEMTFALPTPDDVTLEIIHFIDLMEDLNVELGKPFLNKKNPKGHDIVNLFIYGVHETLKFHKSTLTDSTICSRLASLLTIVTKKPYSRENVTLILHRVPKIPY